MTIDFREIVFESAIEYALLQQGYLKGDKKEFDPSSGLFRVRLINFLKETQPKHWAALQTIYGEAVESGVIQSMTKAIQMHPKGLIGFLRDSAQGKYKDRGIELRMFFMKPDNDYNPNAVLNYQKNRLSVTRQVYYSIKNENSLDVVIDLNGFPIITMELKNPLTGQTFENAIHQYKNDRDPAEPIFRFNERSLVHFALDTDEIHMTTELKKEKTYFLPFNKGDGFGKGNPEHPTGYKTTYLWEDILQIDSLFEILQRFIELKIEKEKKDKKKKKQLLFPRYHQLNAVRKIAAHVYKNGTGHRYLIQHSAGSGKSNTIAWTAHRLASLADASGKVIFNTVVVVTDRIVLDSQIQDTIRQFDSTPGFVAYIDKGSQQLADALSGGSKVIVTTLQKFPFVIGKLKEMPQNSKYAIIMDEAHSSQTGMSSAKMKDMLTYKSLDDAVKMDSRDEDELDMDDQIAEVMAAYERRQNLSMFAFTATPKKKTMQTFGTKNQEGDYEAFDLYSMRQAIEERFIHDVLKNYTTYDTYYKINKAVNDDPEVESKKAKKGIAKYISIHPTNLSQKAFVIIEHFRSFTKDKIGGKAKAMVVTSSRLHAKRYMDAFKAYLKQKEYTDLRVLVAFSSTVEDVELDEIVSEAGMNGFPDTQTADVFEEEEYKIMIVADKYQTGFDQPLLHTMYVDKKLTGIKAVQTLSRLNRMHPEKSDTFVLDFVNDRETIKKAFQPYYEKTEIDEETDPNLLYDYRRKLDDTRIYEENEINAFCDVFFQPKAKQSATDQAKLYKILQTPEKRFKELSKDEQNDIKVMMKKFVSLYLFLSQLVEYEEDMKRYFTFIRLFYKKISDPIGKSSWTLDADLVDLEFYRIKKAEEGQIELEKGVSAPLTGGVSAAGGKRQEDYKYLSVIVQQINERFGTNLDGEIISGQLYEVAEKFISVPGMKEQVDNNSYDDFKYPFENQFIDGMVDSFEEQKEQLENQNDQLNKLVQFVSTSDEGCKMISDAVGKIVYNLLKK
ncbi:type I restriction endonuclease subunit R [Paenibacillus sp. MWE-103]|uniref:Type I restriction endonuclease subunit R n=1 Tax=Paenibacillus artemisiicola TaxID=1172618 RepID=A0ABS3WFC2_9BACL|nr:DEAD/DEAH box helicase family protein [Paenibacillus artemisiicola]MBO7747014.1 type I restriction endonuclease subunit R [Paenibacillus artemisiicola]